MLNTVAGLTDVDRLKLELLRMLIGSQPEFTPLANRYLTLEDLLEDPHLEETGFWKTYEHPTEGTIRLPDLPTSAVSVPGRAAAARKLLSIC